MVTKKFMTLLMGVIFLVACGADDDLTKGSNVAEDPITYVDASLDFSLEQKADTAEKTRSVSFERSNTGAPKVNLTGKTTMPVTCVFYNATSKATTIVKLNFDVTGKNTLKIGHTKSFQLATRANDDPNQWYVMGFIGGTLSGNTLKFNQPFKHVRARENTPFDFDIPFAFLWKKLRLNKQGNNFHLLRGGTSAVLKPIGTVVRLQIRNRTTFPIKYNGFTLISSGSTIGEFALNKIGSLPTTQEAESLNQNLQGNDARYQELINTLWVDKNERPNRPKVAYTNYKRIDNEDTILTPNQADQDTYWVWFIPQEAARGGYDRRTHPNLKAYKTQFLLHSKAVNSSSPEVAMLPVYGSKANYQTGNTYIARGTMLYEYGPLNYMAKENLRRNGTWGNTPVAQTQYSQNEMQYVYLPNDFPHHIPTRMEWQSIFPRFGGLGMDDEWMALTPAKIGPYQGFFAQYGSFFNGMVITPEGRRTGRFNQNLLARDYHHIVTLCALPNRYGAINRQNMNYRKAYAVEPELAICYKEDGDFAGRNYAQQAYGSSFNRRNYPDQTTNKYQTAIRIDNVDMGTQGQNPHLLITQRYLGPNYVISPYDIQDDRYWKYTGRTDLSALTEELQRSMPMWGVFVDGAWRGGVPHTTWLEGERTYEKNVGAIYWSSTTIDTENILPARSTQPRLPLYLNVRYKEYSRTDNGGDANQDRYYLRSTVRDPQYKFKGMVRLFRNNPANR